MPSAKGCMTGLPTLPTPTSLLAHVGPHPFPSIVRDYQRVIGREIKAKEAIGNSHPSSKAPGTLKFVPHARVKVRSTVPSKAVMAVLLRVSKRLY
ncbi:hypothetical protein BDN67DRAFT_683920 [Paxillus ammoniavirescens]|nr:hypothetical protein BDN67DRAFT_683920 [Paxillus ammoniavirescens]